jgi:hypothetical protein
MVGDASWLLVHIFCRLHPIYVIKHWLVSQSMKEIFKKTYLRPKRRQTRRLGPFLLPLPSITLSITYFIDYNLFKQ